ncbi:hypothetical protein QN277_010265 [Acacia crassicarpa]|uniref:GCK domain-containing protein n=1 Tax=Acacia crassicarpa TaxID=499986 RepID=A0AAE1M5B9_9FABA|nr:hypothetical protein QN277_010265 [Acacia crassicarpa]
MSTPDTKRSNSNSETPPSQTPTQQSDLPADAKPEDAPWDLMELEDEEEGECGLCLYMEGGGCRDSFIDLEKCIEAAEKNNEEDIEDKCAEVTAKMWVCMEAHADYYEPIFRMKKAAEKQFVDELEKEAGTAEQTADQSASQSKEASKDSAKEAASNDN